MVPDRGPTDPEDAERDLLEDVVRIQQRGGPDRGPASPLKKLQEVAAAARQAVDTLRHIVQEPQDAAAQMCGGLVSKEYGAHEPAHTEHHLYRGAKPPAALVAGDASGGGSGGGGCGAHEPGAAAEAGAEREWRQEEEEERR